MPGLRETICSAISESVGIQGRAEERQVSMQLEMPAEI